MGVAASRSVGCIRGVRTGRALTLEAYSPVGRAAQSRLSSTDDRVSNEHACLRWSSSRRWTIRDLGSTNGTWLNGQVLVPGTDHDLALGDQLAFGTQGEQWELIDISAPEPMACPLDGQEPCVIAEGVIAIPSVENAAASIVRGTDGAWILENANRVTPISPGVVFEVGGRLWRFSYPSDWTTTAKARQIRLVQESHLCFGVSSDEEYVTLEVEYEGQRIGMGQLSAWYLLLTLARIRAREQRELPPAEAGWMHRDDLADMLCCTEQQLNVWVHRVRSRFSSKGFLDYASIIERRDGSGQLRIGVERVHE